MKRTVIIASAVALLLALAAVSVISLTMLVGRAPTPSAKSVARGILIVPVAAADSGGIAPDDLLLAALATDLERTFNKSIEIGALLVLSPMARSRNENSLRADAALDELARVYYRSGYLALVGVASEPLSARGATVSGYSHHRGGACIVSTSPLSEDASPEQIRVRTLKTALHQIGHAFGLAHSADPQSVMFDSKDTSALDKVRAGFSDDELAALRRVPGLENCI